MAGNTTVVSAYPAFVANASGFGGQDVRLGTLMNVLPGLFAVGDFAVSERAAGANMSVDIAQGRAYVDPGQATHQGLYAVRRTSSSPYNTNVDGSYGWAAADATNPRIDLLCIEVDDTEMDGSGATRWHFRIVDGTPNAGATTVANRTYWPAVPTGCLPIAAIRIPAGATTITAANILNLNILGGPRASIDVGVQAFTASGTIDPNQGRLVTIDASGATLTLPAAVIGMRLEVWNISTTAANTATIQRVGSDTINGGVTSVLLAAGGRLVFVCRSAGVWQAVWENGQQVAAGYNQLTASSVGSGNKLTITVEGDGLTPVRLLAHALGIKSDGAAGTSVQTRLMDNVTELDQCFHTQSAADRYIPIHHDKPVPAFTGSKTFHVRLETSAGTPQMAASATLPAFLAAYWAPGARTS